MASNRSSWDQPLTVTGHGYFWRKENGFTFQLEPEISVPFVLTSPIYSPSEVSHELLEQPQTSLPSAEPSHHDDLVPLNHPTPVYDPRSPIYTNPDFVNVMYSPTPPGWHIESRRISIEEKITPLELLGKVGLHCYNLKKGTNLQYRGTLDNDEATGIMYGYVRVDNSIREFETRVRYDELEKKHCSTMITTLCRFRMPQTPDVEGDLCAAFDKLSVDDFFKCDMPNWVPEDVSDNPQYYEMKESDVEEHKEWLLLYAELAFFTTCGRFREKLRWAQPFDLRKIIVQTREDVESKKKAKAENAIFYIAFKTGCSVADLNAIIRRTTDGTPEHMSLEVKVFKKKKVHTIMSN